MRKFLIDTDTASDDAVALIMAHCWADVQVVAFGSAGILPARVETLTLQSIIFILTDH